MPADTRTHTHTRARKHAHTPCTHTHAHSHRLRTRAPAPSACNRRPPCDLRSSTNGFAHTHGPSRSILPCHSASCDSGERRDQGSDGVSGDAACPRVVLHAIHLPRCVGCRASTVALRSGGRRRSKARASTPRWLCCMRSRRSLQPTTPKARRSACSLAHVHTHVPTHVHKHPHMRARTRARVRWRASTDTDVMWCS